MILAGLALAVLTARRDTPAARKPGYIPPAPSASKGAPKAARVATKGAAPSSSWAPLADPPAELRSDRLYALALEFGSYASLVDDARIMSACHKLGDWSDLRIWHEDTPPLALAVIGWPLAVDDGRYWLLGKPAALLQVAPDQWAELTDYADVRVWQQA